MKVAHIIHDHCPQTSEVQLCSREERKESTSTSLVEILSNVSHFKFDFKSVSLLMHYFQALRDRNR